MRHIKTYNIDRTGRKFDEENNDNFQGEMKLFEELSTMDDINPIPPESININILKEDAEILLEHLIFVRESEGGIMEDGLDDLHRIIDELQSKLNK